MKKGHHSTRRRRRRSTRARRRRNPFIAEYLLGNPRRRHRRRHNARGHHRRHHRRYRRNPFGGALVGQLQRNPVRYLQIGGMGALGIYGTITGGNWLVAQFLPSYQAGADWTSRAVRYGSRIASAAVLDMALGQVVRSGELRLAFRAGAGIAIVGGILLDVLGKNLILGAGDQFTMPGSLLAGYTTARLPGTALRGYTTARLPGTALRGTGAWTKAGVTTPLSQSSGWS